MQRMHRQSACFMKKASVVKKVLGSLYISQAGGTSGNAELAQVKLELLFTL